LNGVNIREGSKGAGSAVTTQTGINVNALTFGSTIYGYRGQVASAANKWNLYMDGTAANYIAGEFYIGSSTDQGAYALQVTGAAIFSSTITVLGGATFLTTSSALTDGAGASAGTITNAPAVGNPTKWIQINDNGTTRKIPTWQ